MLCGIAGFRLELCGGTELKRLHAGASVKGLAVTVMQERSTLDSSNQVTEEVLLSA